MSGMFGGTVTATIWVTPGPDPTYQISPVVLPSGRSNLIFNLVTLNLVPPKPQILDFESGIGIQLDEGKMREKKITVTNLELLLRTKTQWGFQVDNQAAERCVLNFQITVLGEPGPYDPTIIFTTDPVIPPPL